MKTDGRSRSGQAPAFLVDRPGRGRVRSGDQVDRLLESRSSRCASVRSCPNILDLHTSHNTGALWGFGATIPGSSLIFAGLSVVAAVVILYYLFVLGAASHRVLTVALGLIMAGAMGNCYDRLAFGYVRDFVYFHVDAIGFDARSSTSPITCWSPERSRWFCTPCGPKSPRRRRSVGRTGGRRVVLIG